MSQELLDILSNSNKDIDNQQLMGYLSNKLSAEDKHDLEKKMVNSVFINDAMEGLQDFKNKQDLSIFVDQLNTRLHKQLEVKKRRKDKRTLKDHTWVFLAIILILLLTVVCFLVIYRHLGR